jgi:hypothetical protein
MVRADIGGFLEPVARRLGQHLALEGNGRQDDIEGAEPVRRDDDAAAIRQIVILTDLAIVAVRQFRDMGVGENAQIAHRRWLSLLVPSAVSLKAAGGSGSRTKPDFQHFQALRPSTCSIIYLM